MLDPFRIALIVIFLFSIGITGYHRFQAARSGEKISRRDEGRLLFLSIRLSGLALFIGMLLYLIVPRWMAWGSVPLPDEMRWAGAAVGLFALLLLYWTLTSLGKNLTDTVAIRVQHTLVTNGPYRWVRHPFYVAVLLLICAAALLSANWFLGGIGLFVFLLLAMIRISIEERKLVERFGEEYRSYMKRTRRFLPRLWK